MQRKLKTQLCKKPIEGKSQIREADIKIIEKTVSQTCRAMENPKCVRNRPRGIEIRQSNESIEEKHKLKRQT